MVNVQAETVSGLEALFSRSQFTIDQDEKEALLLPPLKNLMEFHRANCKEYAAILNAINFDTVESLGDLPYLPVQLFKRRELKSITDNQVFKVLTSSGTSGQAVSKVYLDRTTANLQSRALASIMMSILGSDRRPMIIIDTQDVLRDRKSFSARGAGILGMMPFGRDHFFALNQQMELDITGLHSFLNKFSNENILLFGFTFMVWKYFLQVARIHSLDVDLRLGTLIHSGGWKKLENESVTNQLFKTAFTETMNLTSIHNFYGMVEQVGSVFLEGPDGYLYPPNFADVIIRDPTTWNQVPHGEPGIIEVLSVLPHSYPGQALLTQDIGIVHGNGQPESGWFGKRLEVLGRVAAAELRGCSDTHEIRATP